MENQKVQDFVNSLQNKVEKNFETLESYQTVEPINLFELSFPMHQIYMCLMLDLFIPSVTMTNHVLERLLKLAIISKLSRNQDETESEKIHDKFDCLPLAKIIEAAEEETVIDNEERIFLMKTVKDCLRNGFSHAETGKILQDIPDKMQMFKFSFSDPTKMEPVIVSRKVITGIGQQQINDFAEQIAFVYYKFIFELFHKIEKRIS